MLYERCTCDVRDTSAKAGLMVSFKLCHVTHESAIVFFPCYIPYYTINSAIDIGPVVKSLVIQTLTAKHELRRPSI